MQLDCASRYVEPFLGRVRSEGRSSAGIAIAVMTLGAHWNAHRQHAIGYVLAALAPLPSEPTDRSW